MESTAEPEVLGGEPVLAMITGAVAAGLIDLLYAIGANLQVGVAPIRVLQSVASGLLGRDAYQGGAATALLGTALHFAMTLIMAASFVAAARSVPHIRRHLIAAGLAYGVLIYFAMRWMVVPLSYFPGDLRVVNPVELAVHAFGVGLVIALATRRCAVAGEGEAVGANRLRNASILDSGNGMSRASEEDSR